MKIKLTDFEMELPDDLYADDLLFMDDEFISYIMDPEKKQIPPKVSFKAVLDILQGLTKRRFKASHIAELSENDQFTAWFKKIAASFQMRIPQE